jgi:thioredoxin-related protein
VERRRTQASSPDTSVIPMKNFVVTFIAILVAAFLSLPATAQQKGAGFDPTRDAAKDIEDAIHLARKLKKRILIDVGDNACGWCRNLSEFFETNEEAARLLRKNYILVKVNWSLENENKEVLSRYPKIPGYPHLFVLDRNGKLLHSQRTFLLHSGGYHDPAKVISFLKKWGPEP